MAARLLAEVDQDGRSPAAISVAAGLNAGMIRDIVRRPHQSPTLATIEKLASELKTSPEWLAYGVRPQPHREVPLLGEVAAGVWRTVDATFCATTAPVSIPPLPEYPIDAQFDLLVRGTSLNRIARDGDLLRCVSTTKADIAARTNDIVVVERYRKQEGEVETTAKRFKRADGRYELWPASDDPKWNGPIVVEQNRDDKNEAVLINAIVVFVFRSPMVL
ncbi:SOS-response transcriptional repressor LexA (RecA-mediated autopeptidase) [Rhodoblastus acidophilus]|uniref:SOS-response transcriptional repressor LexA (RecA-mediated autopeptidase) n=1 Tax=Rhodoblastus acidophilus TaxID=1074 RepID=A0A212SGJ8_RHOAC|nr:S24 family peptidase [Rhodoblastus acidophilus]MCW2317233.1 SOS-response transcriptional repressor LexA [Rhodoblastus acidophilus]SNB84879.1 SOS-response transcriptional repressor LexA (RecA-mediated autopeptidase) [Rhodoblastus acidophilus]